VVPPLCGGTFSKIYRTQAVNAAEYRERQSFFLTANYSERGLRPQGGALAQPTTLFNSLIMGGDSDIQQHKYFIPYE